MNRLRVWICPECSILRAFPSGEIDLAVVRAFPSGEIDLAVVPRCDAHTEHWPDGDFTRSVSMVPTDLVFSQLAASIPAGPERTGSPVEINESEEPTNTLVEPRRK